MSVQQQLEDAAKALMAFAAANCDGCAKAQAGGSDDYLCANCRERWLWAQEALEHRELSTREELS